MKKINQKATHRFKMSALVLSCLALLVVSSILPFVAYAETTIPDATSQFYVNDFADVFTDEEEARLMDNAVALADEYDGIQVVVTTIKSLGGDTIENYALNMYNNYGIGKDDMGLLILLSTGDREIYVATGLAIETYFPDSKVGRFIDDYAIPYLAENKFNEGLINLQEAYINEIKSCVEKEASINATVPKPTESTSNVNNKKSDPSPVLTVVGVLLAIATFVVIAIVVYKLTIEKNHKAEIASLNEQLDCEKQKLLSQKESQRQDSLNQKRSFESQLSRISSNHTQEISSLENKLWGVEKKYDSLMKEYNSLQEQYKSLQERYSRVETLHPEINQEIADMIAEETRQKDMAVASAVDEALSQVINLTASKDIVTRVRYALSEYSNLNQSQKSYVTSDVSKVNALYDASRELQREYEEQQELKRRKACAATALATITAIIAYIGIGKAKDLSNLRRAKSIYDNLDSGSRSYFDRDTANKLNELLAQAERDQRRIDEEEAERRRREREEEERRRRQREEEERRRRQREEEERRRRQREEEERRRRQRQQSMYHSSSSFGGSRSHGGFGGRSGGGGAGRKF